jgi:hypothetical protein
MWYTLLAALQRSTSQIALNPGRCSIYMEEIVQWTHGFMFSSPTRLLSMANTILWTDEENTRIRGGSQCVLFLEAIVQILTPITTSQANIVWEAYVNQHYNCAYCGRVAQNEVPSSIPGSSRYITPSVDGQWQSIARVHHSLLTTNLVFRLWNQDLGEFPLLRHIARLIYYILRF